MARVKKKKAPEGYRWKTVTKLNAIGRPYTTHVLVNIAEEASETEFKKAKLESYKAFTPYPGQSTLPNVANVPKDDVKILPFDNRFDRVRGGKEILPSDPNATVTKNLLGQALDPIKNIPIKAEEHRLAGIKAMEDTENPFGKALGGLQWLASPISGTMEALWDKPVSDNLQNVGMSKKAADNVALYSGTLLPFLGQVKNVANVPKAINLATQSMRRTKGGQQAVTDLKTGINSALTNTKVEYVLHAATRTKPKPTVRPAAVADDTAGLQAGRQREYVPGADFAEDAASVAALKRPTVFEKSVVAKEPVQPRPTVFEKSVVAKPPQNLADQSRRSSDALTRAEANAAIARINTMEASGLEASAANRMRAAVESKVVKVDSLFGASLADEHAALAAGRIRTTAPVGAGRTTLRERIETAPRRADPRSRTTSTIPGATRTADEGIVAPGSVRVSPTVAPVASSPFRARRRLPQAVAAGTAAALVPSRLGGGEPEVPDRVGGSGYQQWDKGVQDSIQPDATMGGGPQDRAEAYAAQVGGQPRTNNIGGQPATEEQMSWAEKYYGAKFARDPAARYKKNKEFKQSLWKKMAILNAIAALTGNTSQAEQYATYALGMHEDAMQFDDDMRMHKMHKAVYFRPDGTFDPPKNSEAAYNRAIQIGASPDEAKEVYGFTPTKKSKDQYHRVDPNDPAKWEHKRFDVGDDVPEDWIKGKAGSSSPVTTYAKSKYGKMIAEMDTIREEIKVARAAGQEERALQLEDHLALYKDRDDAGNPSTNFNRLLNWYETNYINPMSKQPRGGAPNFWDWVRDTSNEGGARYAAAFGVDQSTLASEERAGTDVKASTGSEKSYTSEADFIARAESEGVQSGDWVIINGVRRQVK